MCFYSFTHKCKNSRFYHMVADLIEVEVRVDVVVVVIFKKNTLEKKNPDRAESKFPESSTHFELIF